MEVEEIEKRISSNGYEVICRNICGTTLAIAPKEKVYIYTIIPSIPTIDNLTIQKNIDNHNELRKSLKIIFEDTLEDIIINIESVFICIDDIPQNIKNILDENKIIYISPYVNDNHFDSIFPKIDSQDSNYDAYKLYIGMVVMRIIACFDPKEYNCKEILINEIAGSNYWGFNTIKQLIENCIDHGEYIEFIRPIDGITMIQKCNNQSMDIKAAIDYVCKLNVGGFTDWQLPSIENLKTLYKLNTVYNIIANDGVFWSSSWFSSLPDRSCEYLNIEGEECLRYDSHRTLDFKTGTISSIQTGYMNSKYELKYANDACNIICIRSSKPSEQPQEHLQPIKIMGEPFELDVDISKLKNNFIDHGDYIEFKEPINGILMVQKKYSNSCKLEEAEKLANEMNLGGYNDWLIPTIQELQTLYHIRDYLDMKKGGTLWSSSTMNKKVDTVYQLFTSKYHIVADYINEEIKSVIYKRSVDDYRNEDPELLYENTFDNDDLKCNTRCIRIVNERLKNRENEMEIDSYGGGEDCIIQPIGYTIY